jgi:putative transposase
MVKVEIKMGGVNMLDERENQEREEKLKELTEYLANVKDIREWKRVAAVKWRLSGKSYAEIQSLLGVSGSFIAQTQRKYLERGLEGLKLEYKGSKSYLTTDQMAEIQAWLILPKNRNISELERHLIEQYDVVFKSPESYYQILKESQLSWQKGNKENPRKDPELIDERNQEIAEKLTKVRGEIESGELISCVLDECHLQGDDICNYLWGNRKNREIVKVANDRDRQTYYGALNLWTKEFIVSPYSAGNGQNTVKFLEEIKARYPQKKLLLIWDSASYHIGEEMKEFLARENQGKPPENWAITCMKFGYYAPSENPVEGIWLQVKNFIRRFYYICKNFSIVKRLFQFFFKFCLFNPPDLKKYDAFAQLI